MTEQKSAWWNSDILKVERSSDGADIDVTLSKRAPPIDSFVETLIAIRLLLARHNVEPNRVVLEFDAEMAETFRSRLCGCAVDNADGSFSWGGFVIKAG